MLWDCGYCHIDCKICLREYKSTLFPPAILMTTQIFELTNRQLFSQAYGTMCFSAPLDWIHMTFLWITQCLKGQLWLSLTFSLQEFLLGLFVSVAGDGLANSPEDLWSWQSYVGSEESWIQVCTTVITIGRALYEDNPYDPERSAFILEFDLSEHLFTHHVSSQLMFTLYFLLPIKNLAVDGMHACVMLLIFYQYSHQENM